MRRRRAKEATIKLAPQEKQKLVEPIQDIFLEKVLGIEGALITDESRLSDFVSYPRDRAIRAGTAPGTMVFEVKRYIGPRLSPISDSVAWREETKKPQNWRIEEIESEPGPSKVDIAAKAMEIFGVDISAVIDSPLVDILLHVANNYKRKGN